MYIMCQLHKIRDLVPIYATMQKKKTICPTRLNVDYIKILFSLKIIVIIIINNRLLLILILTRVRNINFITQSFKSFL